MSNNPSPRYDKFLWTVRLFKTRSLATDACKNGRILLNGIAVKPSRLAEINDEFTFRKAPATLSYRIKSLPPSRVGAKLVSLYIDDLTPESEKEKLDLKLLPIAGRRQRGMGRPTKKARRDIDRMKNSPD
ncbi:MAG: RNA-binding S4 domain-containing protein [Bacteroidia bacterium]|nr:MAG: RNA-binding S4 domain-containing protein [Bacteroidia bacterium]